MATSNSNGGTTKDRILDIATDLFLERGYGEAPLSAIAAEAGITKASRNYHFPSKDALLMAIVAPFLSRIDTFLDAAPEQYAEFEDRRARRNRTPRATPTRTE